MRAILIASALGLVLVLSLWLATGSETGSGEADARRASARVEPRLAREAPPGSRTEGLLPAEPGPAAGPERRRAPATATDGDAGPDVAVVPGAAQDGPRGWTTGSGPDTSGRDAARVQVLKDGDALGSAPIPPGVPPEMLALRPPRPGASDPGAAPGGGPPSPAPVDSEAAQLAVERGLSDPTVVDYRAENLAPGGTEQELAEARERVLADMNAGEDLVEARIGEDAPESQRHGLRGWAHTLRSGDAD